jgi:hypothetical protein
MGMFAPNLSDDKHIEMQSSYDALVAEKYTEEQLDKFLMLIAASESGGNYKAWNRYGYIGKYQFGSSARRSTGFGHVGFWAFRKNPDIWSEEEP